MQARSMVQSMSLPVISQFINTPLRRSKVKSNIPSLEYMESFKNSDGKYQCNYCERSYLHFKHLKRHFMKHTGNRPHVCNICQDTFCRSDILKRHYSRCLSKFKHTGKCPTVSRVPKRILPNQLYGPTSLSYNTFLSQVQPFSQSLAVPFQLYSSGIQQNYQSIPTYSFSQVSQFKPVFPPTPNGTSPNSNSEFFNDSSPQSSSPSNDSSPSKNIYFSSYQVGPANTASETEQLAASPTISGELKAHPEIIDSTSKSNPTYMGQGLAIYEPNGKSLSVLEDQTTSTQDNSVVPVAQQILPPSTNLTPSVTSTASPRTSIPVQYNPYHQHNGAYASSVSAVHMGLEQPLPASSSFLPLTAKVPSFPQSKPVSQFDETLVPNSYQSEKTNPNFVSQFTSLHQVAPLPHQPMMFNNSNIPSPPTTASSPDSTCHNPNSIGVNVSNVVNPSFNYTFNNTYPMHLPLTIPSPNSKQVHPSPYLFRPATK